MTLNITVNQNLRDIFNSIDNPGTDNRDAKVIIRDGQMQVDNRSRGIFSFRSRDINPESQRTLDVLRNALVTNLNDVENAADKVENILRKHLNEKQLLGRQRLTLRDLTSIRSSFISLKTVRRLAQEFQQPEQANQVLQQQGNQQGQGNRVSARPANLETAPAVETVRNMAGISREEKNSLLFLMNLKKNLPIDITTDVKTNEDINSINAKIQVSRENAGVCANALRKLEEMLAAHPDHLEYNRACQTLRNHFQYLKTQNDILNTNASGILDHKADLARNFKESYVSRLQGAQEVINFVKDQVRTINLPNAAAKNEALNRLTAEWNRLQNKINAINQINDLSAVDDDKFKDYKKTASHLSKKIKACVAHLPEIAKKPLSLSKDDIQECLTRKLSASDKWDVIEKTLHLNVGERTNKPFKFKLTPLNKLPNVFVSNDFRDFDLSGNRVKNYASGDRKTHHITNLSKTEVADENGDVLFSGYRHGTTAAFGLKDNPAEMNRASVNRTTELLRTIVEDKYRDKIDNAVNRDNAIEIKISSVSLLTPITLLGNNVAEKSMFDTQCRAWDHFSPSPENPDGIFKIKVRVPDPNHPGEPGPEKEIYIKPSINTFNFPCQIQSTRLKMGWHHSDLRNNDAMNRLVGSSLNNTLRSVNEILDPRNQEAYNSFVSQIKNDNSDLANFLSRRNVSESEKNKAIILALEIKMLEEDRGFLSISGKEHRQKKVDPYALPARVALLNHILGNETCFNCKSGKDRTGQLDAEVRTLAATLSEVRDNTDVRGFIRENSDAYDILKNGSYRNANQKKNLTKVALNSGIMEIHQLNTGIMGSKVKGNCAGGLINLGGGTPYQFESGAFDFYKGKSSFAKS